ncbi:MAG: hypothetical protein H0U59_02520 [Gemmatimonadaceae bacterium]|nr:hypothetical protein [Gemmatimonadaceae bacterium]
MTSPRSLKLFGLTEGDADLVLYFQGHVCAVCKRPPKNQALGLDHDHHTGAFRGFLCPRCNRWLVGNLTVEQAEAVFVYLANPPAEKALARPVFGPKGPLYPKKRKRRKRNRRG